MTLTQSPSAAPPSVGYTPADKAHAALVAADRKHMCSAEGACLEGRPVHELDWVKKAAAAAALWVGRAGRLAVVAAVDAHISALMALRQPPRRSFDEPQVGVVLPARRWRHEVVVRSSGCIDRC